MYLGNKFMMPKLKKQKENDSCCVVAVLLALAWTKIQLLMWQYVQKGL